MRREYDPHTGSETIGRLFELLSMRNAEDMTLGAQRSALEAADAFFGADAPDPLEEVELNLGRFAVVVRVPPNRRPGRAVVYFHGGGFCIGSPKSERGLSLRIAEALHSAIIVADYRLAPEHPYPAALEDAIDAVRWTASSTAGDLLGDTTSIVVGGTSAGANLAVTSLLSLRDSGDPAFEKVAAVFCITGWFDVTNSSASQGELQGRDPLLNPRLTEEFANSYLLEGARDDPLVSPVFADLVGLPPVRLDGAECDSLRDDSRRMADALEDAGVDTHFVEWKSMPHMFPFFSTMLSEGRAYIYDELPRWMGEVTGWE